MNKYRTNAILRNYLVTLLLWLVFPPIVWPAELLIGTHSFHPLASNGTNGKQIELIKELGMKVIRIGVSWRLMEPRPGKFQDYFWEGLDQAIHLAETNGLKVIVVMSDTPCWASSDPNKICNDPDGSQSFNSSYPPVNPVDYGNALRKLVKRYGNRVYAWEVWNEPNIVNFWPKNVNRNYDGFWPEPIYSAAYLIEVEAAEEYVKLLKAAYVAIKDENKSAIVLGGSIAGGDSLYLNALYQAGIKGLFDALALHPYSAVTPTGSVDGPTDCNKPPWCFKQGVEEIRRLMVDVYGDDKPIWFTEFGVSSFSGWGGVTEQQQAQYLSEAFDILTQWSFVPVVVWYNLVDLNNQTSREGGFGLYRSNFSLKPVGEEIQLRTTNVNQSTEVLPLPISPLGHVNGKSTGFLWKAVTGASSYLLWANDYANTPEDEDIIGIIQKEYSPTEAICTRSSICQVNPGISFNLGDSQWWVTANYSDGTSQISHGAIVTILDQESQDADNDGISEIFDNCVYSANPDQRDTDNDGIGNRCDPDFNNDGRVDFVDYDYFRLKINTTDQDTDMNGDGIVNILDEVILKSVLNGSPGPSCCVKESASGLW